MEVVHSVVETPTFLADAKQAGMDAHERSALVSLLAESPDAGDIMAGTGGARKLRFKRPGTGKSGATGSSFTMLASTCRFSC